MADDDQGPISHFARERTGLTHGAAPEDHAGGRGKLEALDAGGGGQQDRVQLSCP